MRKENGREKPWYVPYWGVGNESWGCGGNMTPEQYADMYRRYATFCHSYPGAPLKKIASGPNGDDAHWMEVMMKNIPHNLMWGVSLHYYTIPTGNWGAKGSATDFDENQYFSTMKNALHMDNVINNQVAVMDKYDPKNKVALAVDEWGVWTDAEPGTNPAFLYQQNSLRDALAAASTLNIFNNHSDRVKMANLAQTVNVLQALVLTKGAQMVLTPTYFVFGMYKVHQDATLLPIRLVSPDYVSGNDYIPAVNASASKDSTGAIHISLVNIDPLKTITIRTTFEGSSWKNVTGKVLTSDKFNDVNTFENPDKVKVAAFSGAKKDKDELVVTLPPKSVVVLELK
jgi:alpha-N-arabinofuranosidase